MKKLLTLIFTGLSVSLFSQRGNLPVEFTPVTNTNYNTSRVLDTVIAPPIASACQPNAAIGVLVSGTDFIGGTNSFGDLEKAQLFGYPGGGSITKVMVFYGAKKTGTVGMGNTNYTLKMYGHSSSGPNAFLGTSAPITYMALDTTGNSTMFTFNTPVNVPDSFYVSAVVGALPNMDTVALLTLFDGTNPTNQCGNNTAWERQGDNSWHLMNGTNPSTEWGVDVQFLILPIINGNSTGLEENSPVTAHKVYPNPAADFMNLSYQLIESSDVKIEVIDMKGSVLYTRAIPSQIAGTYNQLLDVTALSNGVYNYTITTSGHSIHGKFIVN